MWGQFARCLRLSKFGRVGHNVALLREFQDIEDKARSVFQNRWGQVTDLDQTKGRLLQLDSVRGLAALSVLIFHGLNSVGTMKKMPHLLLHSPFRVLWEGPQAVILFFILSGFVLSLPWYQRGAYGYGTFVIKRVCRIYIPYFVAVTLGIFARILYGNTPIAGVWGGTVTVGLIIRHYLLIDSFNQNIFDPVVWSLVHEMRISLIFPLIMLCVLKLDWKRSLIGAGMVSAIGIALNSVFESHVNTQTNYFDTLVYVVMFVVGALMAKHREQILTRYRTLPTTSRIAIFAAGLLSYAYSNLLHGSIAEVFVSDWITTLGGAIVIACTLVEPSVSKFLQSRPVAFVDKISYSLYLYHWVIFLSVVSVLSGKVPSWGLWTISVVLSFITATLSYYVIELNGIKLGRILTSARTSRSETSAVG